MRKKEVTVKPVLQALVLAERVYEDKSGKKIIAGTFNTIFFGRIKTIETEWPDGSKRELVPGGTDIGSPSLYISLTDVVDGTEISLQFVNVSKNQVVFGTGFKLVCKDRLATVEIIAPLPPFSRFLKEEGVYSIDVVWKDEILGFHRIVAKTTA